MERFDREGDPDKVNKRRPLRVCDVSCLEGEGYSLVSVAGTSGDSREDLRENRYRSRTCS